MICAEGCCYHDAVGRMLCESDPTKEQLQRALELRDNRPFVIIPAKRVKQKLAKADTYVVYRGNVFLPSCAIQDQNAYKVRHADRFKQNPKLFIADLLNGCKAKK